MWRLLQGEAAFFQNCGIFWGWSSYPLQRIVELWGQWRAPILALVRFMFDFKGQKTQNISDLYKMEISISVTKTKLKNEQVEIHITVWGSHGHINLTVANTQLIFRPTFALSPPFTLVWLLKSRLYPFLVPHTSQESMPLYTCHVFNIPFHEAPPGPAFASALSFGSLPWPPQMVFWYLLESILLMAAKLAFLESTPWLTDLWWSLLYFLE